MQIYEIFFIFALVLSVVDLILSENMFTLKPLLVRTTTSESKGFLNL